MFDFESLFFIIQVYSKIFLLHIIIIIKLSCYCYYNTIILIQGDLILLLLLLLIVIIIIINCAYIAAFWKVKVQTV